MATVLQLSEKDWRDIFPKAPDAVIKAFAANPKPLDRVGITQTPTRLAYALAIVKHECGGFAIPGLTENIKYSAKRTAEVWPNRFTSEAAVKAKYGIASGWQLKALDDIYGRRMGNRPGTNDGSRYIGRGGPQITGRDGYIQVGKRCGLDLLDQPELATLPEHQPAILAAFWEWKDLSRRADALSFEACVKAWNGGRNGLKERRGHMEENDAVIRRLKRAVRMLSALHALKAILDKADPVS